MVVIAPAKGGTLVARRKNRVHGKQIARGREGERQHHHGDGSEAAPAGERAPRDSRDLEEPGGGPGVPRAPAALPPELLQGRGRLEGREEGGFASAVPFFLV